MDQEKGMKLFLFLYFYHNTHNTAYLSPTLPCWPNNYSIETATVYIVIFE